MTTAHDCAAPTRRRPRTWSRTPPPTAADPRSAAGGASSPARSSPTTSRSVRFLILLVLVALAGLAAVHSAAGPIRAAADSATQTPSIFLYLFTLSPQRVPAFHEFLGILGPLLGIAFGFDAINGERAQGTLPRLVAQPIHRDEIINGKFVAGLAAIALHIGIRSGDRVAVLSRNSHAFAAVRFALARIGAVLVPVNFMLNPDEIAFILRSSGAVALAVGPDFVETGMAAIARDTKVAAVFWLPGEPRPHRRRRCGASMTFARAALWTFQSRLTGRGWRRSSTPGGANRCRRAPCSRVRR